MTAPHVFIAMPSNRPVEVAVFASVRDGQTSLPPGTGLAMRFNSLSPLHVARQELVKEFLADARFTHLWFVDDDIVQMPMNLALLLKADVPIAVGAYALRFSKQYLPGLTGNAPAYGSFADKRVKIAEGVELPGLKNADLSADKSVQQVDWAGMGCALLRRDALEKLPYDMFRPHDTDGEDVQFAINCRKAGIPINLVYSAEGWHLARIRMSPWANYTGNVYWVAQHVIDHDDKDFQGFTRMYGDPGFLPDGLTAWVIRNDVSVTKLINARKAALKEDEKNVAGVVMEEAPAKPAKKPLAEL